MLFRSVNNDIRVINTRQVAFRDHGFRHGGAAALLSSIGVIHAMHRVVVRRTMDASDIDALIAEEVRSEEHTSELQSRTNLVCRLLLEKKKKKI